MDTKPVDRYFDYLTSIVGGGVGYEQLLKGLFSREFYSPINLDENRAEYGLLLRNRYCDIFNDDESLIYDLGPCRVLEMLVALAENIDTIGVIDIPQCDKTSVFFWMMINNLGFNFLRDENWDCEAEKWFNHRIDILLDRKYNYDGSDGGLFPLQFSNTDQRKIEIWYQMQSYFLQGK